MNDASPRTAGLPYLPGLEGLRALAVTAVVLYHGGQTWLPGGFLGVEVFLVISGYIITSRLLWERRESGRVDAGRFWARRALRLLPALFTMLLLLLAGAALVAPAELPSLRADSLAAFFYVTNWDLILGHRDYFESFGRPPLLQHLWSLAVEEQFYIIWPLVFALLIRFLKPLMVVVLLLAAALASAAFMAMQYHDVYDASRIYYGTDTRACGLLLGAALAFAVKPAFEAGLLMRIAASGAGFAGLAVLGAIAALLGQYDPILYQGGFLLTGLATAAVVVSVAHPSSTISRVAGLTPLRWVGARSYGIYLWHWPLLLLTAPLLDGAHWWTLPAQVALIVAVADASYRLVEVPARNGALGRIWSGLADSAPDTWSYRRTLGTIAAVVGIGFGGVSVAALAAPPASASHSESVEQPLVYDAGVPEDEGAGEEWAIAPHLMAEAPAAAVTVADPPPQPPPPPPPPPLPAVGTAPIPSGISVTAIGDSVLLGASRQLAYVVGAIDIDADIGRQVWSGVSLLQGRAEAGTLGDVVVVAFGSNGSFTGKEFDQVMAVLSETRLVVFVNVRVPKPWEQANNSVIARGVSAYANAVLVDWYGATEGHPELFSTDGVHLTGTGVRLYAGLIADTIVANWK